MEEPPPNSGSSGSMNEGIAYNTPNNPTVDMNTTSYMSHEMNGTVYFNAYPGPDPAYTMPYVPHDLNYPPYGTDEFGHTGRRSRGKGSGRGRGRPYRGNWNSKYGHNPGSYGPHTHGETEDSMGRESYQHQAPRTKFRSYQESRQGRAKATQADVSHNPADDSRENYTRENYSRGYAYRGRGSRPKTLDERNVQGSSRAKQNSNRNYRDHTDVRDSAVSQSHDVNPHSRAYVENLNYTYGQEGAENSRKWEHETASAEHYTKKSEGNKSRMTALGKKSSRRRGEDDESSVSLRDKTPWRENLNQGNAVHKKASNKNKNYRKQKGKHTEEDNESQRGNMSEQLRSNAYECMVCCDNVRREAAVWSCNNCYRVFHLGCTKKWARSPAASVNENFNGWRCPACQNVSQDIPKYYYCFCGKVKDPDWNRFETPHSCGDLCRKQRGEQCTHPCNILCHPGPCPPCHASIMKTCDCGKTKQTVKCDLSTLVKCQEKCTKTLNCGSHECQKICHAGPCDPCSDEINQVCCCGKEKRTVVCGTAESFQMKFNCEMLCERVLECGNHRCEESCHPGQCSACSLSPEAVTRCPCQNAALIDIPEYQPRSSCLDPVPTCMKTCGKGLRCGPIERRHLCKLDCHEGECPACDGEMELTCRCGLFTKDMTCQEASQFSDSQPFACERRCNRKKPCGRHKCSNLCCVDDEHPCDLICGRKLSCGLHRCEEPCHKGNCPTCWQVSFDELRCYCGAQVLYPPVACGTRAPECSRPCTREHECSHTVTHNCHSDENCPPCIHLKEMWCLGRHELRKNIPCYLNEISCGMPCGKELPCGAHKCQLSCHKGACLEVGETCTQLCSSAREECGHPCHAPCHVGNKCPQTACKAEVKIYCECGNRTEKTQCNLEITSEYQKMAASMLAMKLSEPEGQGIDITGFTKEGGKKRQRKLECNSECAILERNKRLALALEIKNPDLSNKLGNATFTMFLKDYAKQNLSFTSKVEKAFSELVKAAEQSKQPRRSHAFDPMPAVQRRFVHELAEFYGCESQSYDVEPKKNVVITAHRDRCWHPNVTLTVLIQRELNPKAPMPIPHRFSENDLRSAAQAAKQSTHVFGPTRTKSKITFTSKNIASSPKPVPPDRASDTKPRDASVLPSSSSWSSLVKGSSAKPEPAIDYFDMTD